MAWVDGAQDTQFSLVCVCVGGPVGDIIASNSHFSISLVKQMSAGLVHTESHTHVDLSHV